MTDEKWVEFVKDAGKNLDERIDNIGDLITYGRASQFSTAEWLAMSGIYKLLCEHRTSVRVEAIRSEIPISQ